MEYSDSALDTIFPGVSRSEALQAWYAILTPEWREAADKIMLAASPPSPKGDQR